MLVPLLHGMARLKAADRGDGLLPQWQCRIGGKDGYNTVSVYFSYKMK
jgi:hypothetical protein